MSQPTLVLGSVALGVIVGGLITWGVFAARASARNRAIALNPDLPRAAVEILAALDFFAVILDASLKAVYANPAAKDDALISGEQLREPEFLELGRRVMSSGVSETILPDPETPGDTVRIRVVRVHQRFLAVLVDDLGEEQRVNNMRRDFIANVSHELKTPIAAIGLLSEAVLEAADEPPIVRSFAKKLRKESLRLGNLSRDIIQLSEAQSALRPEEREAVSLSELLRAEVEAHREFAVQQGVELVFNNTPDTLSPVELHGVEPIALGRPTAIRTVFANLLSNAVRHSPEGGRVGVGMEIGNNECLITVTDQGEGIAPEHLSRIFERFYRVDNARSRDAGGTGLGLSIARHTMQAHGGNIEVWSQHHVGSTFTVTFPLLDTRDANGKFTSGPSRRKKKPKSAKTASQAKAPKSSTPLTQGQVQLQLQQRAKAAAEVEPPSPPKKENVIQ